MLSAQDTLRFFPDSVKTDSVKVTWKVTHPELVDSFVVEHCDRKRLVKNITVMPVPGQHVYCQAILWSYGDNGARIGFYGNGRLTRSPIANYTRKWPYDGASIKWVRGSLDLGGDFSYEIYDKFGNCIRKGQAKMVDVSDLPYDVYYLIYNNKVGEFIAKKKKR